MSADHLDGSQAIATTTDVVKPTADEDLLSRRRFMVRGLELTGGLAGLGAAIVYFKNRRSPLEITELNLHKTFQGTIGPTLEGLQEVPGTNNTERELIVGYAQNVPQGTFYHDLPRHSLSVNEWRAREVVMNGEAQPAPVRIFALSELPTDDPDIENMLKIVSEVKPNYLDSVGNHRSRVLAVPVIIPEKGIEPINYQYGLLVLRHFNDATDTDDSGI